MNPLSLLPDFNSHVPLPHGGGWGTSGMFWSPFVTGVEHVILIHFSHNYTVFANCVYIYHCSMGYI